MLCIFIIHLVLTLTFRKSSSVGLRCRKGALIFRRNGLWLCLRTREYASRSKSAGTSIGRSLYWRFGCRRPSSQTLLMSYVENRVTPLRSLLPTLVTGASELGRTSMFRLEGMGGRIIVWFGLSSSYFIWMIIRLSLAVATVRFAVKTDDLFDGSGREYNVEHDCALNALDSWLWFELWWLS